MVGNMARVTSGKHKRTYSDELADQKQRRKQMVDKLHEREKVTGRELKIVPASNRDARLPLEVLFDDKKGVSVDRLAVWVLQTMGSLTETEVEDWLRNKRNALTVNEILALELLQKTLSGDREAQKLFWNVQQTLLRSKGVSQQITNITINRDAKVKTIIDSIAEDLFD